MFIIIRKAFGGAYIAMCSKHLGADFVFAWPTAEIAVMGAEGAVNIVHSRDIQNAADSEAIRNELIKKYNEEYLNPRLAAKAGYVDEVIEPSRTRRLIFDSLKFLADKRSSHGVRKRHGNVPM